MIEAYSVRFSWEVLNLAKLRNGVILVSVSTAGKFFYRSYISVILVKYINTHIQIFETHRAAKSSNDADFY